MHDTHNRSIQPVRPESALEPARFDDEIDLVDLVLAVWRRRWLVVAFIVIGVLLGLGVGYAQKEQTTISAVLSIGKVGNEDRETRLVEETSTVRSWLESALIPAAADRQADVNDLEPTDFDFSFQEGDGGQEGDSGSIVIRATTIPDRVAAHITVIEQAAERAAEIADKPIRGRLAELRAQIRSLELGLERLEDDDRVEAQRLSLKNELANRENELASLKDEEDALRDQRQRLDQMIELEEERAANINRFLSEMTDEGSRLSPETANEAMTAMFLGSQVQQYLERLAAANEQITVELPRKIKQTQNQLAEVQRKQVEVATEVERNRLKLKNFEADHRRDVDEARARLVDAKAGLENVQETGLINVPQVRAEAARSPLLFIALGAILGSFLGLFAALMANFVTAARERLHETERKKD